MRIATPEALWWLWLIPVLGVFFAISFRARRRRLDALLSPQLAPRLSRGASRPRRVVKALLVLLGLGAAVLALAEPQWGFTWEEVQRRGVDVVVALDVSRSMLVTDAGADGQLTRLERARREVQDLLDRLQGDRIGLVAFAGTAFVECPLTLDHGAARLFLGALDTDLIPLQGTDLAGAIRTSLQAFEEGSAVPSRAILLITDGEDHSGEALAAAEEAAAAGVRIFALGIGREEGAPVPAADSGFRRDRRGEIILSRLDETTLQKIALSTGGRYVRSVTGDADLDRLYAQGIKATLEEQELASRRRQRWHPRFQWALALALGALSLETLIPDRKGRREDGDD